MVKKEENKKRTHILIDKEDIDKYELVEKTLPFKNHLHSFTIAAFLGYYYLDDSKEIKKTHNGFIHLSVFQNSPYLVFIKSLAIAHEGDPIILEDEKTMYGLCEEYARAGIEQLYEWCLSDEFEIKDKLSEIMLEKFEELNVK